MASSFSGAEQFSPSEMSVAEEQQKTVKSEINTVFGRCRCCNQYGYMKNIWEEHYGMGEREVYGEMLLETFSIAFETTMAKAYICEPCIVRLRDSFNFKNEILSADEEMDSDSDDMEMDQKMDQSQWLKNEDDTQSQNTEDEEAVESVDIKPDLHEYEQVEYLDECEGEVKFLESQSEANSEACRVPVTLTTKFPPMRKDGTPGRYKNYSNADMCQAIKMVQEKKMSIRAAAMENNVPRKTLAAKLQNLKNEKENPKSKPKQETNDRQSLFAEEVKKVLDYTTAVPFKTRASKYHCAFCYQTIPYFETPTQLRDHMKTHVNSDLDVARILRPHFKNETLRVDINEFSCKVCNVPLETWNDMFLHLSETHSIALDEVYSKLIPYNLSGEIKVHCALCCTEFPNFQFLDSHMNAHFANYMCPECGDTFVSEVRMKHHELIHDTGKYPCSYCGKVFSMDKYRRKHEAMVHGEFKMFRCIDCGEQFVKEYERHLHMTKVHPHRIKVNNCEFCDKSFKWRPYYLAHLRKVHSKVKKHECMYCKKRFVTKHEMSQHVLRHTGEGKHVCPICNKNYVTPAELRLHSMRHVKDMMLVKAAPTSKDKKS